ncbi:MAG: hypothetical protein IJS01_12995, partial [Lentisphaeria bacterium]|nr:hypothetical protein [Lentisphaeria bacterium]
MKSSCIPCAVLFAAFGVFAFGDPDFERTEPQELPMWTGAQWAKATTVKFSAKVVEDPKSAASGKRFLRIENPNKTSAGVIAHPGIKKIAGYGLKITGKVRGDGLRLIGVMRRGADGKNRKWHRKQETGFKRLNSETWEPVEFTYIPEEEDASFLIRLAVRDGRVDFDDFKLEPFRIDDGAAAAPKKKAPAPAKTAVRTVPHPRSGRHLIFSDFETWQNGLPQGWKRHEDDTASSIRRFAHGESDLPRFGRSGLFLDGKIIMEPPMRDLAVPRSRPMRLAFYAKGENGRIRARLHEGRNGFVDYLVDLVDEPTTSEWKKYATAFSLPPACRIDNAAVELIGENVIVDNVEFKAARGGDGKLVYSIPVVKTAPVIDGKASPGEWDCATGAS